MSLVEQMKRDLLDARKAARQPDVPDGQIRVGLLTALVSEVQAVGKTQGNRETSDAEAIAVVRKFIANAEETKGHAERAASAAMDRPAVEVGSAGAVASVGGGYEARKAATEIGLLRAYLPQQMNESEMAEAVDTIMADLDLPRQKSSMGKIMAALKERHAGRYDGKQASEYVARRLA